jgi:hypothetical protein
LSNKACFKAYREFRLQPGFAQQLFGGR